MKSDRGENGANSEESEFLQCEFSVMTLFSESTFFMFAFNISCRKICTTQKTPFRTLHGGHNGVK